ncbi:MAG TPA: hypothetical protein VNV66_07715 [Pilimelia sp.]|nr:hypothetical protein [Pilimelia sp.]
MGRYCLRRGLVPLAGLLVLASSFLPWWTVRILIENAEGVQSSARHASAGAASWQWSVGLALGLGVVVCWAGVEAFAPRRRRPVSVVLAAVAMGGLGLLVHRWMSVEPLPPSEGSVGVGFGPPQGGSEFLPLVRDQLHSYEADGLTAGVGWGAYVGCAATALLIVALFIPVPPTQASAPPPASNEVG